MKRILLIFMVLATAFFISGCAGDEGSIKIVDPGLNECAAGQTLVDGKCVITTCDSGQELVDGKCECTGGKELIDGNCACPAGQVPIEGICKEKCGEGKIKINDQCVDECSGGKQLINGTCKCDDGEIEQNGTCVIETVNPLEITAPSDSSLTSGLKGNEYGPVKFTAKGGTGDKLRTWTIGSGALPVGLALKETVGGKTAELSGKPTELGNFAFKVVATDKTDPTMAPAEKNYTLEIHENLAMDVYRKVVREDGKKEWAKIDKASESSITDKIEVQPGEVLKLVVISDSSTAPKWSINGQYQVCDSESGTEKCTTQSSGLNLLDKDPAGVCGDKRIYRQIDGSFAVTCIEHIEAQYMILNMGGSETPAPETYTYVKYLQVAPDFVGDNFKNVMVSAEESTGLDRKASVTLGSLTFDKDPCSTGLSVKVVMDSQALQPGKEVPVTFVIAGGKGPFVWDGNKNVIKSVKWMDVSLSRYLTPTPDRTIYGRLKVTRKSQITLDNVLPSGSEDKNALEIKVNIKDVGCSGNGTALINTRVNDPDLSQLNTAPTFDGLYMILTGTSSGTSEDIKYSEDETYAHFNLIHTDERNVGRAYYQMYAGFKQSSTKNFEGVQPGDYKGDTDEPGSERTVTWDSNLLITSIDHLKITFHDGNCCLDSFFTIKVIYLCTKEDKWCVVFQKGDIFNQTNDDAKLITEIDVDGSMEGVVCGDDQKCINRKKVYEEEKFCIDNNLFCNIITGGSDNLVTGDLKKGERVTTTTSDNGRTIVTVEQNAKARPIKTSDWIFKNNNSTIDDLSSGQSGNDDDSSSGTNSKGSVKAVPVVPVQPSN